MENIELIYSLFNQYVYQEAKNNIEHLDYYFSTNPTTSGNRLIKEFLGVIRDTSLSGVDLPVLLAAVERTGKSREETNKIICEIRKWKGYNRDQIKSTKKLLRDICAQSVIKRANTLYSTDPSGFLNYVRNTDFRTAEAEYMSSIALNQIDINSIIADENSEGITSKYEWINESFQPYKKYEKGQLVIVSMAPGSGKSLFALSEALHMSIMGHRVHYLALGDLCPKDQIIRMAAMYTGLSFGEVRKNLGPIYEEMSRVIGDRLSMTFMPAGEVTVEEYIDFIESQEKQFDVLFVDYDSNFKSNARENMYSEYGAVYEKLTRLTAQGKLIFVLAQPKVQVWGQESIELQDIGESSRKQHAADIIITRGRVTTNPNHLGIFKIVKNRRGETGAVVYSIRLSNGRFVNVPKNVYDLLKENSEKRNYTEQDIKSLMGNMSNQTNKINQTIEQAVNASQFVPQVPQQPPVNPTIGTPFEDKKFVALPELPRDNTPSLAEDPLLSIQSDFLPEGGAEVERRFPSQDDVLPF